MNEPTLLQGAATTVPLPSLPDVQHRFVDLQGLRVHVAEAGMGPAVLLLHGFPQHWWEWRQVIPRLAERHHVICPDLRGMGWTAVPTDGCTTAQLVGDVVGLLDALGIDRVDLIGHDVGGILGYRLCLAHPERVRRFLAIAAPHPYPAFEPRMLVNLWRVWSMFAVATPVLGPRLLGRGGQRVPRNWFLRDAEAHAWSERDIELYLGPLRDPARARAASALHRELMVRENARASAGRYRGTRLRVPTLSLYGTVLVEHRRDGAEHPTLLAGFEDHADDLVLERLPATGFYLVDERPDVVAERALELFAVA
jgi:pimeloyl-ACP methyl ester carboxylesterase